MTNKELLIDFINYAKTRHAIAILDSQIDPLVEDYFNDQKSNNTNSGKLIVDALQRKIEKEFAQLTKDFLDGRIVIHWLILGEGNISACREKIGINPSYPHTPFIYWPLFSLNINEVTCPGCLRCFELKNKPVNP